VPDGGAAGTGEVCAVTVAITRLPVDS
jgi:hypothetical protein